MFSRLADLGDFGIFSFERKQKQHLIYFTLLLDLAKYLKQFF